MKQRLLPDDLLRELARTHGTPLWIYDAATIRARIASLSGFDIVRYAQKANPNLAILRLVRASGARVDAVSAGEIERALAAGFTPEEIVFTADLFDRAALALIARHGIAVNLGSADMLEPYAALRSRAAVTLRVNPGFGHGHGRKVNTGGETSKHGIWHEDLPEVVRHAATLGLAIEGLHVHIGSGSDFENLARVTRAVAELAQHAGGALHTLSAGGGLPVPYREHEPTFDVARFTRCWREAHAEIERVLGRPIGLEVEPGRYLVAEAGLLLTEVRSVKQSGRIEYVLVDAGFHTLVRPAMYGAWHEITVVGSASDAPLSAKVVAGPLCESGDVFTQGADGQLEPRDLPSMSVGDLVCLHDAGAYGAAMSSNYNSQPLAAEVLVDGNRTALVRRRQTIDDILALERPPFPEIP